MRPVHINFLIPPRKGTERTVVLLLILLSCAIFLTGVTFYTFCTQKKIIEQYRIKASHYTSENKKENPLSPAAMEQLNSDILFLNTLLQYKTFSWIDILNRIESSVDEGVLFTQIEIDREKRNILLLGRADSAENLSLFIKRISSESMFLLTSLSQESKQNSAIYFDMGMTIRQ